MGMRDRPTCAHDAGWGGRRFGGGGIPRLFDNRWMHVCRNKCGPSVMAGGRMAFSHEITRLPGGASSVRRAIAGCSSSNFDAEVLWGSLESPPDCHSGDHGFESRLHRCGTQKTLTKEDSMTGL